MALVGKALIDLVAFYKSAAAAQGANIVRREYGLPETYVPCADPHLIQDVVPTRFEGGAQPSPAANPPSAPAYKWSAVGLNRSPSRRLPTLDDTAPAQAQRFSDLLKQDR